MRFLLFATICAAATPAVADEPFVSSFNGYFVTVISENYSGQHAVDVATPSAERACASVGKAAEYQGRRVLNMGTGEFFFLCL